MAGLGALRTAFPVRAACVIARFDERPGFTVGHDRFVLRTPMRVYAIESIAPEAVPTLRAHAIGLGGKVVGILVHTHPFYSGAHI
jgi:hypothetical protein